MWLLIVIELALECVGVDTTEGVLLSVCRSGYHRRCLAICMLAVLINVLNCE